MKLEEAIGVVQRADKILPGTWKEKVGVGVSGGDPDWSRIAEPIRLPSPARRGSRAKNLRPSSCPCCAHGRLLVR